MKIKKIILFCLIPLFLTCTQDFTLKEALDGPDGKKLTLTPASVQIGLNETISFQADGGVPDYSFIIISGAGVIDQESGIFTAPGAEGTTVIAVNDSYGSTETAAIQIITGSGTPVLIISPSTISVFKGTDATFSATGGVPPYTFSLSSGIGGITAGGLYTAPNSIGAATVTVTDSALPAASTDSAAITVTDIVTNVNYEVTTVVSTGGTTGSGALSADFEINNTESSTGSENVNWTAYISSDQSAGAGDTIASSGIINAADLSDDYELITASGTWPDAGGDYYILIVISAADDLDQTNNSRASASVTVSEPPVADIDYQINSISSVNTPALEGSGINENFTFRNSGTANGSSTVSWTAYRSINDELDGSDVVIDSGTSSPLALNTTSANINITGTWPASAGAYFIIVKVSASDDINPLNNSSESSQFVINAAPGDIDYIVTEITDNFPSVITDQPVSEYFSIANIGGSPGSDDVTWTAYASTNTTIEGGDFIIGSGTASTALPSGGETSNILVNGFWPPDPDSYFLIVSIAADDETISGNNIEYKGPFTISTAPDYNINSTVLQNTGTPGDLLSDAGEYSFIVNNPLSAGNGTQSVLWKVYRSFDNIYDPGDIEIKTGSFGALASNTNSASQYFDDVSWPLYGSNYFLIIKLSAFDEINTTDNIFISPSAVESAETYTDSGGDNDASNPTETNYDDLDLTLVGGNLDEFQLIKITGTTDTAGNYDTYKFTLGPAATKIDFYAEWAGGGDIVDLFLWDNSSVIDSSISTDTATEPASPPSRNVGLTSGNEYKIGVLSKIAGRTYTIYISTRP